MYDGGYSWSSADQCMTNDNGGCDSGATGGFATDVAFTVAFEGYQMDVDPIVQVFVDASGASPLVPLSAYLPAAAVLSL